MKVKAHVYVTLPTGPVLLRPGDDVPEGATVTNPEVIDGDSADEAPAEDTADEAPADETPEADEADEAQAEEPAPAPRKRQARKAADSE